MIGRKYIAITSAATVLAASAVAYAQTGSAAPTSSPMGVDMLLKHLSSQGFADFSEVERKSDKLYEVTARDAAGLRWEMYVDARTGEVLKQERD